MPSIADARTVLVIGATAGLGRALAKAIRDLPSKPTVVAAGRRRKRLEELAQEGGILTEQLDINLPRDELIPSVNALLKKYPDTDAVIFSAGVQRMFNLKEPQKADLDAMQLEWYTNFVSPITQIFKCFLPHFQELEKQGRPTFILPITSGLAAVPASAIPVYSATKAALHSFCMSMAKQLDNSNIHVVEIVPPLVESELHDYEGTTERLSKLWMPLAEWTKLTMDGLLSTNGSGIVAVGSIKKWYDDFEVGKVSMVL
ncbi:NAD(P)-binding protein [Vararia minispora EC-137]|uniref:NAD(P)-binding protein n=1 Tax=Vararia minispora EC-137 TaxID=1314806 RepID=A0ACB8QEN7_9AGAM|nr:NAD(P)-binding protein [Vararia minispora EC-137]